MSDPVCKKFHPGVEQLDGYIPCWPWRCKVCAECSATTVDWNWFLSALWAVLIGWWWDGRVKVRVQ
jgi:hypothetical protein